MGPEGSTGVGVTQRQMDEGAIPVIGDAIQGPQAGAGEAMGRLAAADASGGGAEPGPAQGDAAPDRLAAIQHGLVAEPDRGGFAVALITQYMGAKQADLRPGMLVVDGQQRLAIRGVAEGTVGCQSTCRLHGDSCARAHSRKRSADPEYKKAANGRLFSSYAIAHPKLLGDVSDQVQNFAGVAHFVVVPGYNFNEFVVQCDTSLGIEY
ncbi:hypothetical protein D3C72_866450 [compost metagenome]